MRIHVYGLYHTITSNDYSHCAFTGKVLRFAKMMRAQGAEVVEYGNEGSESEANEHVTLRSRARFDELHPRGAFVGEGPQVKDGSESHQEFESALVQAMTTRVQRGDIIAHPLGPSHKILLGLFPRVAHVETGIGYQAGPFGAYRIFESEAWRHWHLGRYHDTADMRAQARAGEDSWVVPNYFDLDEWPEGRGGGGYFAFMARKCNAKGLETLAKIIKAYEGPCHFRVAGEGEHWQDWRDFLERVAPDQQLNEVVNVGALRGRERAKFLGDAVALLSPTQFVEPFGGAAIEAMLCGTPALGSAWGAYTETLPAWAQCRTLDDWLRAMALCEAKDWTRGVSYRAREDYSLETVGRRYADVFEQILKLRR